MGRRSLYPVDFLHPSRRGASDPDTSVNPFSVITNLHAKLLRRKGICRVCYCRWQLSSKLIGEMTQRQAQDLVPIICVADYQPPPPLSATISDCYF
eukprot:1451929-Rhodomonas_salina.5